MGNPNPEQRGTSSRGTGIQLLNRDIFSGGSDRPINPNFFESEDEVIRSENPIGDIIYGDIGELYLIDFEVGKYQLKQKHKESLITFANESKRYYTIWNRNMKITLIGHASPSGTYYGNVTLAKNRARQVKKFLIAQGLAANIIVINTGNVWHIREPKTEDLRKKSRSVKVKRQRFIRRVPTLNAPRLPDDVLTKRIVNILKTQRVDPYFRNSQERSIRILQLLLNRNCDDRYVTLNLVEDARTGIPNPRNFPHLKSKIDLNYFWQRYKSNKKNLAEAICRQEIGMVYVPFSWVRRFINQSGSRSRGIRILKNWIETQQDNPKSIYYKYSN